MNPLMDLAALSGKYDPREPFEYRGFMCWPLPLEGWSVRVGGLTMTAASEDGLRMMIDTYNGEQK
jgi:hypothetical protein